MNAESRIPCSQAQTGGTTEANHVFTHDFTALLSLLSPKIRHHAGSAVGFPSSASLCRGNQHGRDVWLKTPTRAPWRKQLQAKGRRNASETTGEKPWNAR